MRHQFWKNANRTKIIIFIGIAVLLLLGIIISIQAARKNAASSVNTKKNMQTTVDVMAVPRRELTKRIVLSGQTVAVAQVDIAAKYQGRVAAVYADLGQQVAAGQVLIVQDTTDADIAILQNQAAYDQAVADAVEKDVSFKASYDKARADYQQALNNFQRYKYLYDQGGISRQALDAAEQQLADAKAALDTLVNQVNADTVPASVASARAAAAKAQYSLIAAKQQRDDLILRAPRSGIIGFRQVEVGDIVQPGQKLLSIVDNSSIYVDCQVAEQDLSALTVGMAVDVSIDALGQTFPGKIIYLSPANDATSQSFTARIVLLNPSSAVRSGMFARTVVNAVLRPTALVVPKDAVLEKNGKNYVFVINSQNVAEERIVQVGVRGDEAVEIISGLSEGEHIAVNNLARLRSGLVVTPNFVTMADRGGNK